MKRLIVSRRPVDVEFIRSQLCAFRNAPAIESATKADVAGALVAGELPPDLAAAAAVVYKITYRGQPPAGDYSVTDMAQAGAVIEPFVVTPSSTPGEFTVTHAENSRLRFNPYMAAIHPEYPRS